MDTPITHLYGFKVITGSTLAVILFTGIHTKKRLRPHRPCPYCGAMQSKLSRHLKRCHQNENHVRDALNLETLKLRNEAFDRIKKIGMLQVNRLKIQAGETNLLRERNRGRSEKDVKMCTRCYGFFDKNQFNVHSKNCRVKGESGSYSVPVSMIKDKNKNDQMMEFVADVLRDMRNDEAGQLCKTDVHLKKFGHSQYLSRIKKGKSEKIIYTSLQYDLRLLGKLFVIFKNNETNLNTTHSGCIDMLNNDNIDCLLDSMSQISGTWNARRIYSLIRTFAKFMIFEFMFDQKQKSNEISVFLDNYMKRRPTCLERASVKYSKSQNENNNDMPVEENEGTSIPCVTNGGAIQGKDTPLWLALM